MKMIMIILGFVCLYTSVHARPFTILSTQTPPFKYLDKNNEPTGLHVDVWKVIFKELKTDYKFKFVNLSSKRVKVQIEKGLADMHFCLSKTKERMEKYIFPEEFYHTHTYNFFIRAEDKNRIKYDALGDLKGLRVGATKSYTYTKEFWEAGLLLDVVVYKDLQIRKLLKKRIDIAPLKKLSTMYKLMQEGNLDSVYVLPKPLTIRHYYNAFSKRSTQPDKLLIISNCDRIIKKMKNDGTLIEIYEKYFGKSIKIELH